MNQHAHNLEKIVVSKSMGRCRHIDVDTTLFWRQVSAGDRCMQVRKNALWKHLCEIIFDLNQLFRRTCR